MNRRDGMDRAYQTLGEQTSRELSTDNLRELSSAELEQAAGGFVEILVYATASTVAYYQWLKRNHKI
jgi:hypothetical protein